MYHSHRPQIHVDVGRLKTNFVTPTARYTETDPQFITKAYRLINGQGWDNEGFYEIELDDPHDIDSVQPEISHSDTPSLSESVSSETSTNKSISESGQEYVVAALNQSGHDGASELDDSVFTDHVVENEVPMARGHPPANQASHWRSSSDRAPIQLTAWRMRDEDGVRQSSPEEASVNLNGSVNNSDENSNSDAGGYQRLAPEDLPRLFPEWTFGMPFIFDEQMDDETKGCCGYGQFTHSTFVRWFIAIISLIGLACVIVGVVLGALTMSGSTRVTLCLLMIGVGVVLITVSGLAWRLLSLETNDCLPRTTCLPNRGTIQRRQASRTMLAERPLSRISYSRVCGRRSVSHQYFTDILHNPEFVWRPPPPSYQTAVRDRRWRNSHRRDPDFFPPTGGSPPPTYRSRIDPPSRPSAVAQFFRANSRPPSYSAVENSQNIPMSVFSHSAELPPVSSTNCRVSTPIAPPSGTMTTDPTHQDDRAPLVRNEVPEASLWTTPTAGDCSTITSTTSNATGTDRLTIIDCSEPVPVGFELRRGRRSLFWPRAECPRRAIDTCPQPDLPLEAYRYV